MLRAPFTSTLLDIPRPLVDPVSTFPEALGIVALAAGRPLRHESVVLVLDSRRRGLGLHRTGTPDAHLAHEVAAVCSRTPAALGAFVVTFRPGSPVGLDDPGLFEQLRHVLHSTGHHLIDWVVVGRGGFWCPRILTDVADPWDRAQP